MSKVAIVTYTVKEDAAGENKKYIEAVFEKLKELSPEGVQYASTLADDGVTFIHIAHFETEEAQKALTELPEFLEFQRELKSRCDIPPNPRFCDIVGAYNLF